jgi:16S rRNA (guanine1516-N2)-methyltransferase
MQTAAVFLENQDFGSQAVALASRLNLPIVNSENAATAFDFYFCYSAKGLSLWAKISSKPSGETQGGSSSRLNCESIFSELKIDFTQGALDFRRRFGQKGGDLILRAVGTLSKNAQILDLTAGLGRDAFILASNSLKVTSLERNPYLFELLNSGLEFGKKHPRSIEVCERINFINADAADFLLSTEFDQLFYDVIVYDPMFPQSKKTALPKKEMQILHKLIEAPNDESESERVSELAFKLSKRLVIKRPLLGPCLIESCEPTAVFKSGSTRFDVYVTNAN